MTSVINALADNLVVVWEMRISSSTTKVCQTYSGPQGIGSQGVLQELRGASKPLLVSEKDNMVKRTEALKHHNLTPLANNHKSFDNR